MRHRLVTGNTFEASRLSVCLSVCLYLPPALRLPPFSPTLASPATFSKPAFSAPSLVYPMKDISGRVQMPIGNCPLL